jgi:uncharacterized membrane protein
MKKTISFAMMHFCVAFSVAYIMTGSVVVGGRWDVGFNRASGEHSGVLLPRESLDSL